MDIKIVRVANRAATAVLVATGLQSARPNMLVNSFIWIGLDKEQRLYCVGLQPHSITGSRLTTPRRPVTVFRTKGCLALTVEAFERLNIKPITCMRIVKDYEFVTDAGLLVIWTTPGPA